MHLMNAQWSMINFYLSPSFFSIPPFWALVHQQLGVCHVPQASLSFNLLSTCTQKLSCGELVNHKGMQDFIYISNEKIRSLTIDFPPLHHYYFYG